VRKTRAWRSAEPSHRRMRTAACARLDAWCWAQAIPL
jgi:hypothetical protein